MLGPLVASQDIEAHWVAMDLQQQRTVIDALMKITLLSPRRGRNKFDRETVRIEWRSSNADDEGEDWSPEQRAQRLARLRENLWYGPDLEQVPVPEEVEIEILDDPHYVRVGDRFGFTQLYSYDDGGTRNVFCDQGPYRPRSERPAQARVPYPQEEIDQAREHGEELVTPTVEEQPITDEEYFHWLRDQDDEARHRGVAIMRAIQNNVRMERYPHMDMRFWLANQDPTPDPVLIVRCHATVRGHPCRKAIARVWRTEHGLYGVARHRPSQHARKVIVMAEDEDYLRRLDEGGEYEFAPEHDDAVAEIGIAMACPRHGNGTVPAEEIIEAADSKRPELHIDVLSGQTRLHWR